MPKGNAAKRPRFFAASRPVIIGHRGAAGVAPENTMVSFKQAVLDGADILELDVHLTKDKHVVVIHDATVDRTTNGAGKVVDFTLAELQELDAGHHFQDADGNYPFRGKGLKVPTLEEVLEVCAAMPFSIELKVANKVLVAELVKVLFRTKRLLDGSVLCASFLHRALTNVRKLAPHLATSFSKPEIATMVARVKLLPVLGKRKRSISYVFQIKRNVGKGKFLTQKTVKLIRRLGYEVQVWTVNDEKEMRQYIAMGVDGIITDFPGRLRKVMDEQKL